MPRPILLLLLLLLLSLPCYVQSAPYILLLNNVAKCFSVDMLRDSTLSIVYHVPDLILPGPDAEQDKEITKDKPDEVNEIGKDGLDSVYNDRRQRNVAELKKAARRNKDMNILLYQREPIGVPRQRRNKKGTVKTRKQLEENRGQIDFKTGDFDGYVEVCVQSFSATKSTPSRISLFITSVLPDLQKEGKPTLDIGASAAVLLSQSNMVTRDMQRMESRLEEIHKYSESSKEREISFHDQSIKLNQAVRYWPIFRILIVLLAGYLQINHVVQYMKRRRIY